MSSYKKYADITIVEQSDVSKRLSPFQYFEYLIHGYIRTHANYSKVRDILSLIEFFYPGYCIYRNGLDLRTRRNKSYRKVNELTPVFDDPDQLYLPIDGHLYFDIKTLSNDIYSRHESHKLHKLTLLKPSNDFILHKGRGSGAKWISDNINQTVGSWFPCTDICVFSNDMTNAFQLLSHPNKWKVKLMSATERHSFLLMCDGNIFISDNLNKFAFKVFDDFAIKMIDIVSGEYHSLLLDQNYELWVHGSANNCGLFGIETHPPWTDIFDKPKRNSFFSDKKIDKIYCSRSHSCVLLKNGFCYLFGDNMYLQCGKLIKNNHEFTQSMLNSLYEYEHDELQVEYDPHIHSVSNPYLIQTKLPDLIITQAALGSKQTMLLTNNGQLYAFGYNKHNELSQSSLPIITTPTVISKQEIGIVAQNEQIIKIIGDKAPTDKLTIVTSILPQPESKHSLNPLKDQ